MSKKIDVEKIPEKFKTLKEAATIQNDRMDDIPPGPEVISSELWYKGLENFAAQYGVDIYAMSEKDMALIDDRLQYWGN